MNNNMSPQNSLFLTENGDVTTLGEIIKTAVSSASGGAANNIELSVNDTHILWKLQNEELWKELVALSTITGPQGAPGVNGKDGAKGEKGDPGENGFGTKEQYDAIIARLDALEGAGA